MGVFEVRSFFSAFWAESLKIRKSKIFLITILFFLFIPLVMGFLIFISKNPEIANKLGIVGLKSSIFTNSDWPAYFGLLNQFIAGVGIIGFGFATSWVFGREYSDHTIKDLLALPVSRSLIVLSKFMVIVLWCILLSIFFIIFGIIIGIVVHIPGWSSEVVLNSAYKFTIAAILTILLCGPVAFFASYGRGYLLPIGFIIFTLLIGNFINVINLGPYFPWAIPVLFASNQNLGITSYLILFFTSIFGFIGTLLWWSFADQN
jgi:ABC-2 type transport system permease protein